MRGKHIVVSLAVLGLLFASAGALEANPYVQSLVRQSGEPHIYFVDRFGLRHHVINPEVQKTFFGKMKVKKLSGFELQSMPEGRPVDFMNPPQQFDQMRDPSAMADWRGWSKAAPVWGHEYNSLHGPDCQCHARTRAWNRHVERRYVDPRYPR